MDFKKLESDLESIFMAGVRRVDPYLLIKASVRLQGDQLVIESNEVRESVALSNFKRIFVIGFGKATARMAKAMEEILGERVTAGVISVKVGHTETLNTIRIIEASHPVPDKNGLKAAQAIVD
ncbi:MAG: DUF4147 domain-containing protein, partial [Deltaproteobacteria bacterium]|nr:DUF4147 domain-containing protein [Deltaproteobacteria bacterium]